MRRLKRYHMWNQMPYRERTLWTVFDSLQVRATNAGIGTAVIEEAKELYAQLTATAICRGQAQRDAMLAACLWESLKRHETPRMPKDIADVFNIPMKHVTRGIKQFQQLLAIRTTSEATDTYAAVSAAPPPPATSTTTKEAPPPAAKETAAELIARAHHRRAIWQKTAARTTSYEDFIVPFLTNLSIPRHAAAELEGLVRHVCARVDDLGIVPENTPPSLTASVIAFCCAELHITMDNADIARVCGISAVTIQKCLKRMTPWRPKIVETA
jgi:transcription initiation factor TFIIIB Brf1 subunit/transcription initiation factor TFIIB